MAPHSSTLAWKIPWMEEHGIFWATSLSIFTFLHWRRKWQPHSSVLAWRMPGMGEPDGLPSMGLHRVGHDWSDLAAAYLNSVPSLSRVWLFVTPWTAPSQASLSITNSQRLLKLMSIKSVMPSNHLILCRPVLLPSIFPSIRVFSNESVLRLRWSKYWSFNFSISPSNEYSGLISYRMDYLILQSKGLSSVFSSTIVQKHQFFSSRLSLESNSHIRTWLLEKP